MAPPAPARYPRVLHVNAASFPRRLIAAIIDGIIVLVVASGVTAGAHCSVHVVRVPRRAEGPAGIAEKSPTGSA